MAGISVHEAKTRLSELLDRVEAGETITISRSGRPVADLVPHRPSAVIWGTLKGRMAYDEADFMGEDPDIIDLFEGRS